MLDKMNIPPFQNCRLLVCGDVMLDRYWYGDTSRISPEAPVPVVVVNDNQIRAGGAANVALNLASLNCQVNLLGYVGDDVEATQLQSFIEQQNITTHFIALPQFPTIQKLRVLGQNQQLIRMDFEKRFDEVSPTALLEKFTQLVDESDVVILSDYAKGTLSCVEQLIQIARQHGKPVLIDPKVKQLERYRGATLLTPNRKEFEWLAGTYSDVGEIEQKANAIIKEYDLQSILVTLGADGMLLCQREQSARHLQARAREVYDVTGAGDTVIAVLSAVMATGMEPSIAAELANIAAGIVIKKLGSATVNVHELRRGLQDMHESAWGVSTEQEVLLAIQDARAHGEKIVMTNGCFDILHAGHVEYLEAARALGDRLVVAVNTDASISALKGDERPYNTLRERMDVLAALRSVDWVVPFAESTPARLIEAITPDVLVKGQDYQVSEIAGSEHVLAQGGEVKTIKLREGCSTTGLIERIKNEVSV